jgi:hypothetical protein
MTAVVTNEEDAWAAAQVERMRMFGSIQSIFRSCLHEELISRALVLSDLALQGRLALFLGAGVSCSAGLPTWAGLMRNLAIDSGVTPEQLPDLEKLTFYDQARIIEVQSPVIFTVAPIICSCDRGAFTSRR